MAKGSILGLRQRTLAPIDATGRVEWTARAVPFRVHTSLAPQSHINVT